MNLILNYLDLMVDGMGSINVFGISKVFEWEEINIEDQQSMLLKIMLYINAAMQARSEGKTFSKGKTKATKKVSSSDKGKVTTYKG